MTDAPASAQTDDVPNARMREVLDAALALMVDGRDKLTMTGVARRASCSKETLYKWFGDRDGLLTATVQWQAAKVRAVPFDAATLDGDALARALEGFATDLLVTLSGAVSVALNRLAITHAAHDDAALGRIVLDNGRFSMGRRLKPLLEAAREKGLLAFGDSETAFRVFFGLVVRDTQIRLLLGEALALSPQTAAVEAKHAATQFLTLYQTP